MFCLVDYYDFLKKMSIWLQHLCQLLDQNIVPDNGKTFWNQLTEKG